GHRADELTWRYLMRATVMYGAGDVRVESRPDPAIRRPTDAVVRVPARRDLRQRPVALRVDAAHAGGSAHGARVPRGSRGRRRRRVRPPAGRPRGLAVRLGGQHLRLLPRG